MEALLRAFDEALVHGHPLVEAVQREAHHDERDDEEGEQAEEVTYGFHDRRLTCLVPRRAPGPAAGCGSDRMRVPPAAGRTASSRRSR